MTRSRWLPLPCRVVRAQPPLPLVTWNPTTLSSSSSSSSSWSPSSWSSAPDKFHTICHIHSQARRPLTVCTEKPDASRRAIISYLGAHFTRGRDSSFAASRTWPLNEHAFEPQFTKPKKQSHTRHGTSRPQTRWHRLITSEQSDRTSRPRCRLSHTLTDVMFKCSFV